MEYYETEHGIEIPLTSDFDLAQTLDCGQCFRWEQREDGSFFGIAGDRQAILREDKQRGRIRFEGISAEEFRSFWVKYFDLEFDYAKVRAAFCQQGGPLAQAAQFAPGIRILRQDPWEALCSFIISQNNNIPRIKGIIQRLCEHFGEPSKNGFRFPTPERLSKASVEDLTPLRSGFRAKYLCDAANCVYHEKVNLEQLRTLPVDQARASLMQIHGVGPKVAECVLLYGLHRLEAFPMDVWMKRAMAALFPGKTPGDFGAYAGIAQQYIFHYSRCCPKCPALDCVCS